MEIWWVRKWRRRRRWTYWFWLRIVFEVAGMGEVEELGKEGEGEGVLGRDLISWREKIGICLGIGGGSSGVGVLDEDGAGVGDDSGMGWCG